MSVTRDPSYLTPNYEKQGGSEWDVHGTLGIGATGVIDATAPGSQANFAARSDLINAVTYAANMTPDLTKGIIQTISVSDGNAFTIANPTVTGLPNGTRWSLRIANASGGAMGAVTFGAAFKVAFTAPANGKSRVGEFYWDGTNHWLVGGFASDL